MYPSQTGMRQPAYQHRSAERMPASLNIVLIGPDGHEQVAMVRDISAYGFMAECRDFIGIGTPLQCEFPNMGQHAAEVRWGLAGWIGCRFKAELKDGYVNDIARAVPQPVAA